MMKSACKSAPLHIALALLALLHAVPARAQNAKSWVANFGSDANSCTLAQPCATLQHAHDQTNQGGEIGILTPGDYGGSGTPRLQIGKSIHITNDGVGEATILAGGVASGIFIIAGAGDVVSLRGLMIDGQFTSLLGIALDSASALHIQHCVIRNFQGNMAGIGLAVDSVANVQVFVSDTIIFNNGTGANTGGISLGSSFAKSVNAVLDRVHVENNVDGLVVVGFISTGIGTHVIVRDSVISGNAANGIHMVTQAGKSPVLALVERSSLVENAAAGILADGPHAIVLLKESTITRNGTGVSTVNSGQLVSYGTNTNNNNLGPEGTATGFLPAF